VVLEAVVMVVEIHQLMLLQELQTLDLVVEVVEVPVELVDLEL